MTNKKKVVKGYAVIAQGTDKAFVVYTNWKKQEMEEIWKRKEFKVVPCAVTYVIPSSKVPKNVAGEELKIGDLVKKGKNGKFYKASTPNLK